jgi:4-hydroxy-tetrahydrodipicolinate reductase
MSLGIAIINFILSKISKSLYNLDFNIAILDKHHNQKLDSPSGTSYLLAQTINQALDNKLNLITQNQNNIKHEKNNLEIASLRLGNLIGEHSIFFSGLDEEINITHKINSREIFAIGALKACEFILDKTNNLYSMSDLINLELDLNSHD